MVDPIKTLLQTWPAAASCRQSRTEQEEISVECCLLHRDCLTLRFDCYILQCWVSPRGANGLSSRPSLSLSSPMRTSMELPLGQQDTDWVRDSKPAENESEEGPSGPAVCLRAGSHVERPNVLIGVSGNGRYLTRPINQSGLKRLEARITREMCVLGWGGGYQASAARQAGPFSCLVVLPPTNPRHPLTPLQLCLSHSATQPQSAAGCKIN